MTQAAILILSAAAMWLVSGRSRHARDLVVGMRA
jgi:hypothetical protein